MLIAMFVVSLVVLLSAVMFILSAVTQSFEMMDATILCAAGAGVILSVLAIINFAVA